MPNRSSTQQPLTSNWRFKAATPTYGNSQPFDLLPNLDNDADDWLAASVPGTVHQDLMDAGKIADPFFGLNERDLQWVGTTDWVYRCDFDVSEEIYLSERVMLCFDGLDTYATVWLNGERLLSTESMFVPERISVKPLLQRAGNTLLIVFESTYQRGKQLEHEYGPRAAWNGDASRVYVRKAQYHYGWDWGPTILTAGIWRSVYLHGFTARISDLHTPSEVSADLRSAAIPVSVIAEGPANTAHFSLFGPRNDLIAEATVVLEEGTATHTFELSSPALWYPLGYGDQPFYTVKAALMRAAPSGNNDAPEGDISDIDDAPVLDTQARRIGLRRLRLVQEPLTDEPGRTFYFEVNNIPVFCGGANWIPADSFLPRVTPERYRAWIRLAARAHMNMLRVWGGGIYESDAFYDACDEAGILVWQDFQFACGMYPANARFLALVRAEAEANVRRLRHHPSIVLWCGNNEDYQIAQSLNTYDAGKARDFRFPARTIYEMVLPEVCKALDPARPYWPGSPYGGNDVYDGTIGDRHTWEIWHGAKADFHAYPQYSGRFVSEFGMQAAPNLITIESFTTEADRYAESRVMDAHNKAGEGPQRLSWYITAELRSPSNLEAYVYATQFIQAEAVAAAFDGWRRRWNGPGAYRTAGALVWQLNDCWPVTSWSLVDYFLRPKAAYYRARRSLAPVSLGMARTILGSELWAVNMIAKSIDVVLDIRIMTLSGKLISQVDHGLVLTANRAVELETIRPMVTEPVLIQARLLKNQEELASYVQWPDPVKHHAYPDPGVSIQRVNDDMVRIQAERPARGVLLTTAEDILLSDNYLDLMPGEPQIISGEGLGNSAVTVWSAAGKAPLTPLK